MEEQENICINNYTIQDNKSLSDSEEYIKMRATEELQTSNEYATIEEAQHNKSMCIVAFEENENEQTLSENRALTSILQIIKRKKKESCIMALVLIFFIMFLAFCSALTVYNYSRLEQLTLQMKIHYEKESNQVKEYFTGHWKNIQKLNSSLMEQKHQLEEYFPKMTELNQNQLEIYESIEQLNLTVLEDKSHLIEYILSLNMNINISSHVNYILDNLGLYENYPISSCKYVDFPHPSRKSGYYWVKNQLGRAIKVYCIIFTRSICDYFFGHCITGGMMRIAKLNRVKTQHNFFPD